VGRTGDDEEGTYMKRMTIRECVIKNDFDIYLVEQDISAGIVNVHAYKNMPDYWKQVQASWWTLNWAKKLGCVDRMKSSRPI
jgi:hypothetical protein